VTPFSPVDVYRYFRGTRNVSTNLKDTKSQNIFIIIIIIKFEGRITRGSYRVMEVLQIHEKLYVLQLLINYRIEQLRSVRIYANDHE
jgi:hypothetical protein